MAHDTPLTLRVLQMVKDEAAQSHLTVQLALGLMRMVPDANAALRTHVLRCAGLRIGKGTVFDSDLHLSGEGDWTELFTVGSNTRFSGPVRINLGGEVRIGDDVLLGHDVLLLTVDHEIGHPWRRAGTSAHLPLYIENGARIGARATLLPGVTIGARAVVAPSSVVTRDVAPNVTVAGVPARPVGPSLLAGAQEQRAEARLRSS